MPSGWEGNRRSGVALAMRHTPVVYPPTGSRPKEGDEHPAYTPRGIWLTLPFYVTAIGNESVSIQLALCWFPRLAISNADFSNKIHGNNFTKQHSGTVMV